MNKIKIAFFAIAVMLIGVFLYAATCLFCTDVHLSGINGRVCPCEFKCIQKIESDRFRLYLPRAAGETLYINPDSLFDGALSTDAYVLPWFGRKRVVIDANGYADIVK